MDKSQIGRLRRRISRRIFWKNTVQSFLNRLKLSEQLFMLLGGVIIGLLGGYGSVGFKWAVKQLQDLAWGNWTDPVVLVPQFQWYWILLIPAVGILLAAIFVKYFAPEAKGHGVPEVMENVAMRGGIIRPRVMVIKLLASAVSIASGGSVGREGPMVQIGATVGSVFGQITQVTTRKMKTFVGCGAAAGIAATFNAPIAGTLFALEIILGDFGLAQFSPIVVSAVMGTVISHQYVEEFGGFSVPPYNLVSPWEFIPYVVLGLVTGLVAVAFIRTLYKTEDIFENAPVPFWLRAIVGGGLVGAMALVSPEIMGNGYESINRLLLGDVVWKIALVLVIWKILATSITLSAGGSGGVFAPSLFLGAMTGGFVGSLAHTLFPAITASPGAYALVGMAGVVGAATHAPLTAILIIFELTNNYQIILPVMFTTIIATVFAMKLNRESIYSLKLIRRGIDINKGRDLNILRSLPISSAMRRTVERVNQNTTLRELMNLMADSQHTVFFVVDNTEKLQGYITLNDLRKIMQDADILSHLVIAGDIAHPIKITLTADETLDHAMDVFGQEGIDELPIVSGDKEKKVQGTLWRQDVIEAYNREIFRQDMASEMASKLTTSRSSAEPIEIVTGFSILEREVPRFLAGRTIRSTHLRDKYGVEIILVKRVDPESQSPTEIMPHAEYRLRNRDTVLVFGETNDIRKFAQL